MVIKVISILVILFVSYILGVFLAPKQTDEIGKLLGISEFNQMIRNSKTKVDGITGEIKDLNDQTGGILMGSTEQIQRARDAANQMKTQINDTKNQIDGKVNQAKDVYDTANALKTKIDVLTTLSGSAGSASSGSVDFSGSNAVQPLPTN
jgi:methyl-accepting chemotaxis protein